MRHYFTKSLFITAFLVSASAASAQTPCVVSGILTANAQRIQIDNRFSGCYQWRVVTAVNIGAACSPCTAGVELDYAPDNNGVPGTWVAVPTITDGVNPFNSSTGAGALIGAFYGAPWISIVSTQFSGSTVGIYYELWGANSSSNFSQTLLDSGPITLTATQVNAMYTTPILVVPAVGPNTVLVPVSCLYEAIFGSAAFQNGGSISLFYTNTSPAVSRAMGNAAPAFLTTFSANQIAGTNGPGGDTVDLTSVAANAGLYLSNATGNFTVGTGSSLMVDCKYYVQSGIK